MNMISGDVLCKLSLCDAVTERFEINTDDNSICVAFSGDCCALIEFRMAKVAEIRIKGYEVLNETEEVTFDMPDIEILGDCINDAIISIMAEKPHAVGFSKADNGIILTVCDSTDTYEIEIRSTECSLEIYTK